MTRRGPAITYGVAVAQKRRAARRDREPVRLTDPRAIKALAHPARLAVLDELFAGRSLTATECAQIAGLSASAMSYHLRALEKWGIVERAPASADGRERPWRAAGRGLRIDSAEPRVSATAESALTARILDRTRREVLDWISRDHQDEGRWPDISTVNNGARWMTGDDAADFVTAFTELLDRYGSRVADDKPEGARRVRVSFVLVPTDEPDV
jgi:DNA-binding transcriptional ArsR family regulator